MKQTNNHWLLPEGINELLPEQAAHLESLRRKMLDSFAGWGYQLVITPFVEYLSSLLTGTGQDLELQTVKFTDQLSGRLLGIRADITPQAARIDAHQLGRDTPTRLCYIGSVFRQRGEGLFASRSPLQIGAELYGHAGPESDVEILRLMLSMLETAGVKDVYLDLGHVGVFKGLARAAGLDECQEAALFGALQRKAQPEINALLAQWNLSADATAWLSALAGLNGGREVLELASSRLLGAPDDVLQAVGYVQRVADLLAAACPQVPVHFDLAELRAYQYQTGVVFAAFVPGMGQEIARGGRYDHIGEKFGRARTATGFSADLKKLMELGDFAAPEPADLVFAPWSDDGALAATITNLRCAGDVVIQALPGQVGDASAMGCSHRLDLIEGNWNKIPVDINISSN